MKLLLAIFLSISLVSCASKRTRTKYSDKSLRVMVDPKSAGSKNHTKVQSAIVQSGMFTVVDRFSGYQAVQQEQNRAYIRNPDRFANNQKFAHWGKLYGVGAVVIAKSQCRWAKNPWRGQIVSRCELFLSLVDANTGEVVVSVRDEKDSPSGANPNWEDAVFKLSEAYPKHFTKKAINKRLKNYMKESEERYKSYEKKSVESSRAQVRPKFKKVTWETPHDDNFDKNGRGLSAEEVLKRVNMNKLRQAGVAK